MIAGESEKKTKGPDSDETAPLDKPKSENEPIDRAPDCDKANAETSTRVKFILSVPVGDDKVREIIVQFSSEDVAYKQADEMFVHMIEFIDDMLDKKYSDGVHVDDTSIEIVKQTEEKADGVWEEARPKAK